MDFQCLTFAGSSTRGDGGSAEASKQVVATEASSVEEERVERGGGLRGARLGSGELGISKEGTSLTSKARWQSTSQ